MCQGAWHPHANNGDYGEQKHGDFEAVVHGTFVVFSADDV